MDMEVFQSCCCLLSPPRTRSLEQWNPRTEVYPQDNLQGDNIPLETRTGKLWKSECTWCEILLREYIKASKAPAYLVQATKWATRGEFQAFGEELSSLPGNIDYSKLHLLTGLFSAKSIMNDLMELPAPFRLLKIVLQGFSGRNERAGPAARPNASLWQGRN